MSNQRQNFPIFQDSLGDSSWATVSISDECEDVYLTDDNKHDNDEEASMDDTLPLEALDEMGALDEVSTAPSHPLCSLPLKANSAFPQESPALPKDMKEFQPVHCSSSIQLDSAGHSQESGSFDFHPQCCSSKLENYGLIRTSSDVCLGRGPISHKDRQKMPWFKQPAPIIREILKSNPYLSSPCGGRSDDFKPQRCSTALSESELKFKGCFNGLQEYSHSFVPLRSSTGLSRSTSNPPIPTTPAEFKPFRCSTGFQENSVAFLPLRCSTGLNESATFNPPLSSTAHHVNDSNISDFKNLRMNSERGSFHK